LQEIHATAYLAEVVLLPWDEHTHLWCSKTRQAVGMYLKGLMPAACVFIASARAIGFILGNIVRGIWPSPRRRYIENSREAATRPSE